MNFCIESFYFYSLFVLFFNAQAANGFAELFYKETRKATFFNEHVDTHIPIQELHKPGCARPRCVCAPLELYTTIILGNVQ